MHVVAQVAALPGLAPRAVAQIVADSWAAKRPDDELTVLPVSDGFSVDVVGTGLDDVQPGESVLDRTDPRRFVSIAGTSALIDLASGLTFRGGEPRGDTRFLADDVLDLLSRGVTSIQIHVPSLMVGSDLGIGFLSGLSGVSLDIARVSDLSRLADALTKAKARLAGVSVVLTYPAEQRLTGVDGMTRGWVRLGFDALAAQESERLIVSWASAIGSTAAGLGSLLLGSSKPDPRSVFSGVGGGLGFTLGAIGVPVHTIGRFQMVGKSAAFADADLVLAVTSAIGVDIPTTVHEAVAIAEESGIPVCLLADSSGLRTNELAKLGIHGSYEIRPERAFLTEVEPETPESIASVPESLANAVGKIARTWGHD